MALLFIFVEIFDVSQQYWPFKRFFRDLLIMTEYFFANTVDALKVSDFIYQLIHRLGFCYFFQQQFLGNVLFIDELAC